MNPVSPIRLLTLCLVAGWALVFAGCAPRILAPATPPLKLYDLDTSPLHGKKIVIDPGHGGVFTGATGVQGLRESDVNLAVALNLWGLLKEAGAEPELTRTADVALIGPGNHELRADLQARTDVIRTQSPDLFLSLHHNSDIHHRSRNETEIYYQLIDPDASRDLARTVAENFQNRMEATEVRILPGNFFVLRNSPVTSLLGEASFVSNKRNERRLALSGFQRLEAEAYFLGILDYFRKGVPTVRDVVPEDGATLTEHVSSLTALVSDSQGGEIDPVTLQILLDDQPLPYRYDAGTGRIAAEAKTALSNTVHHVRIKAANRNGQWAPRKEIHFLVSSPAAAVTVTSDFPAIPPDGQTLSRVRIRVTDAMGLPVADQTPVKLALSSGGEVLTPSLETRDGNSVGYIRAGQEIAEGILRVESGEAVSETKILFREPEAALFIGEVRDTAGQPLEGVEMWENGAGLDLSDGAGHLFFQGGAGEHRLTLKKRGYLPQDVSASWTAGKTATARWEMVPVENGILLAKKIVLNTETNDLQAGQVALLLKEKLEEAGATVFRPDPTQHPTVEERALYANKTGADLLLSFEEEKDGNTVGYYYSSEEGKRLARAVGSALDRDIGESGHFLVVHTGMPAVTIRMGTGEDPEETALKIFNGLLSYFR